jgi:hypothetical protein
MNRFKKNSYLYDWISCVFENRLYFGCLPNENMAEQLKNEGFNLVVNVTENPYYCNGIRMMHYPIVDNYVPTDNLSYCKFIFTLKKEVENLSNKIYLQCAGGHSRSSLVMTSLLCTLYPTLELKDVMNNVTELHRNRVMLRDIWRHKSPFNYRQFAFLCMLHKNIYVNIELDSKMYNWLSPRNILLHFKEEDFKEKDNLIEKNNDFKNKNEISLEDYFTQIKVIDKKEAFTLLKANATFIFRLRHTCLKKLVFVHSDKHVEKFYNEFFTSMREEIF